MQTPLVYTIQSGDLQKGVEHSSRPKTTHLHEQLRDFGPRFSQIFTTVQDFYRIGVWRRTKYLWGLFGKS